MRKLWPGCAATGMRIGNGAQPRCSGNNLRGAGAFATWEDGECGRRRKCVCAGDANEGNRRYRAARLSSTSRVDEAGKKDGN